MKNKYVFLKTLCLSLALIFTAQSCTDLEENLYDTVTPETFLGSPASFAAVLGAAYAPLYGVGGNGNVFSLQGVTSDEMVVPTRGQDWNDGGHWRRLHTHSYNEEDPIIGNGWGFLFSGVATCNRNIELFQGQADIGVESANAIVAEVRGLRALYYYWLIDMYGNVPIVRDFANAPAQPATNSRQEVFEFIDSELQAILPKLSRSRGLDMYGRVNYWTARMIQAKLYLNSQVYTNTPRWQQALEVLDDIIDNGGYTLSPTYSALFAEQNLGNPEFIFALPYDAASARGFNLSAMTLHYASQFTYNLTFQPWNGFCTVQEFYESYEAGDVRRANNFIVGPQNDINGNPLLDTGAEANDPDGQRVNFTPEINELFPFALRQAGARIGKWEFAVGSQENLNNDFAIFRFADVLLMKAEALVRLGRATEALPLVNQIRARAGVVPFNTVNLDNLLAERGRELFAELTRRSDLIRFGRYNDTWWEKPVSSPTRNIFPIPRSQRDVNPNLTQNPGYTGG